MPHEIAFAESVTSQLEALTARQRAVVLEAIQKHLLEQPLLETRNRKLLRPNPAAPWELRVREFRVFYEVQENDAEARQRTGMHGVVYVLAIGQKKGNVLRIGGKRIEL